MGSLSLDVGCGSVNSSLLSQRQDGERGTGDSNDDSSQQSGDGGGNDANDARQTRDNHHQQGRYREVGHLGLRLWGGWIPGLPP